MPHLFFLAFHQWPYSQWCASCIFNDLETCKTKKMRVWGQQKTSDLPLLGRRMERAVAVIGSLYFLLPCCLALSSVSSSSWEGIMSSFPHRLLLLQEPDLICTTYLRHRACPFTNYLEKRRRITST